MAAKGIREFVTAALEDDDLFSEISKSLKENQGGDATSIVIEIGKNHGYDVTPKEVVDAVDELNAATKQKSEGELSDQDLEDVAGGTSYYTLSNSFQTRQTTYSTPTTFTYSPYGRTSTSSGSTGGTGQEGGSGSSASCFISSACTRSVGLPDDCEELTILRRFRDNWIRRQPDGDEAIATYYRHAPQIVEAINQRDDSNSIFDRIYHELVQSSVEMICRGQNTECFENYKQWVWTLRDEFCETELAISPNAPATNDA